MSMMIETTEELLALLKKLNMQVSSVDELRSLLATINANYNPQAARMRTAKLVAVSVPCALGGIAGLVSLYLTTTAPDMLSGSYFVGALALVWGSCALVSVMALIFSFLLHLGRSANKPLDVPLSSNSSRREKRTIEERVMAALSPDLSL